MAKRMPDCRGLRLPATVAVAVKAALAVEAVKARIPVVGIRRELIAVEIGWTAEWFMKEPAFAAEADRPGGRKKPALAAEADRPRGDNPVFAAEHPRRRNESV